MPASPRLTNETYEQEAAITKRQEVLEARDAEIRAVKESGKTRVDMATGHTFGNIIDPNSKDKKPGKVEANLTMMSKAITDELVEPARARLIPGFAAAKAACQEAGALACSISGAGPTTFALAADEGRARALLEILDETYTHEGVPGRRHVGGIGTGARVTSPAFH